jgi:hypothetical protein
MTDVYSYQLVFVVILYSVAKARQATVSRLEALKENSQR